MSLKIKRINTLVLLIGLLTFKVAVFADTGQSCYEAKDRECLESLYSDIVTIPSPDKTEAIYLHGLLELESENYEEAKKQFQMGVMFGKHEASLKALSELINSGKINVEPFDCELTENPENCLLSIAENTPEESDVAYYFLAGNLAKKEPKRAAEYAIKAAEKGHTTAACLVAFGYAHEKASGPSVTAGFVPELPVDYEKARKWGEECGFGPFKGYNKDYYAKYSNSNQPHKAFATYKTKAGYFTTGAATPEFAAIVAGELCSIYYKREPSDPPCKIVNIDDEWVDYFDAPQLPVRSGSIEDLISAEARKSYQKDYANFKGTKVFVQGPLGNWYWKAGTQGTPLEELKRLAIEKCHDNWYYTDFGSVCEVIEINGEWVK